MNKNNFPSLEEIREEQKRLIRREIYISSIKAVLSTVIVIIAIAILIFHYFIFGYLVTETSMEPSINSGDFLLISRVSKIKEGDICVFYYQNMLQVKRVIGMAGDKVFIDEEGRVFVNDLEIDEPYIEKKDLGKTDIEYPFIVPEGMLFLMGDNRASSIDSRVSIIGPIKEEDIVGKVIFKMKSKQEFSSLF